MADVAISKFTLIYLCNFNDSPRILLVSPRRSFQRYEEYRKDILDGAPIERLIEIRDDLDDPEFVEGLLEFLRGINDPRDAEDSRTSIRRLWRHLEDSAVNRQSRGKLNEKFTAGGLGVTVAGLIALVAGTIVPPAGAAIVVSGLVVAAASAKVTGSADQERGIYEQLAKRFGSIVEKMDEPPPPGGQ
ncbi:MAG: hypothetical protein JSR47_09375 [Proteobacteria bacterium]|nr:hypothetical protein [Pseudomonadota bacterium]